MAGASKELNPDSPTAAAAAAATDGGLAAMEANGSIVATSPKDDSIMSLLYSFAKKVVTVGIIYFVGYMGWSVAWLITPVILSVARESWRKKSDTRRTVAKASALANDKDVILARLHDLPAWVSKRCRSANPIGRRRRDNGSHCFALRRIVYVESYVDFIRCAPSSQGLKLCDQCYQQR